MFAHHHRVHAVVAHRIVCHDYAIVGADPQDFRWKGAPSRCSVGDGSVIREHVIINRGFADPNGTRIGPNCFIMADSHIGHTTEFTP